MHVPQSRTVRLQDLLRRVVGRLQIGVTDIKMQPKLWYGIENFAQLGGVVELPRKVFDHQPDAGPPRVRQQILDGSDIPGDIEITIVEWRVPIGMYVHPGCPYSTEHF